jgi:hypothetical protein
MPNAMVSPGLGRVPFYDSRNERFRIRALAIEPMPTITMRYWNDSAIWLDQGATSQCTAYSLLHYMADGPVTHRANPLAMPRTVYEVIQAIDRSEGRDYGEDGGATMLAQSKAALSLGWYGEYRWGYTLDELIRALLLVGPVLLGTNWYDGQMNTDLAGRVHVTGRIVGGHAYVVNGVNTIRETVRIKNSWSRQWGANGHATMSFADLNRLIAEDGEVVLPRELKVTGG